MRGFTDLLISFHVMKGICGQGPALFGCMFVLAMPLLLLAVLIDQLYPGGIATFAARTIVSVVSGFH